MKIAALAQKLRPALPLLVCPNCGAPFTLDGASLVCQKGHCFDLSAKGYLNLAPSHDQNADKYDDRLFQSRRAVFEAGFYRPVLAALQKMLTARFGDAPFSLMDVGCGEGYYARELAAAFPHANVLGVDLSRDAIMAAARAGGAPNWLVADLKRLPVCDGALDAVLDVLTPADYAEFARTLKPGGELMKVVPGAAYLREVREAVRGELRSEAFDNARVLEHLRRHADILEQLDVRRVYPLTPEQSAHFLRMTPMTFGVPEEKLQACHITQITIHMTLVRCKVKG